MIAGVLVVTLAASTDGPTGLIDQITIKSHAAFDYVAAVVLIASPFLFRFTDDSAATALFIVLGMLHLLVSIGTRYLPERDDRLTA